MDMDYEWDEAKNFSNFLKHHIRFEDAVLIFKDLHALEMTDDESLTEIRISARRSTFRERIEYEKRI